MTQPAQVSNNNNNVTLRLADLSASDLEDIGDAAVASLYQACRQNPALAPAAPQLPRLSGQPSVAGQRDIVRRCIEIARASDGTVNVPLPEQVNDAILLTRQISRARASGLVRGTASQPTALKKEHGGQSRADTPTAVATPPPTSWSSTEGPPLSTDKKSVDKNPNTASLAPGAAKAAVRFADDGVQGEGSQSFADGNNLENLGDDDDELDEASFPGLSALVIPDSAESAVEALQRAVAAQSLPGVTKQSVEAALASLTRYPNVVELRRSHEPLLTPQSEALLDTARQVVQPPSVVGMTFNSDKDRARERVLYSQANELLRVAFALSHTLALAGDGSLMGAQSARMTSAWLVTAFEGILAMIAEINLDRMRLIMPTEIAASVLRGPAVSQHFLDSQLYVAATAAAGSLDQWRKGAQPRAKEKGNGGAGQPRGRSNNTSTNSNSNNNNNNQKQNAGSSRGHARSPKRVQSPGGKRGGASGTPAKAPAPQKAAPASN